jgi:hypothetical protein
MDNIPGKESGMPESAPGISRAWNGISPDGRREAGRPERRTQQGYM